MHFEVIDETSDCFEKRHLTDCTFTFGFRFKIRFGTTGFYNKNRNWVPAFVFQFSNWGLDVDESGSVIYNYGLYF